VEELLMPKATNPHFVKGASAALTIAKSITPLVRDTTDDYSKAFPRSVDVARVILDVDSIAGGALALIWNLAADAAGDHAITEEFTSTILVGATTATRGTVVKHDDGGLVIPASLYVEGKVYLVARTSPVGSCNVIPRAQFKL
jgi:hypothetical protein